MSIYMGPLLGFCLKYGVTNFYYGEKRLVILSVADATKERAAQ